MGRRKIEMKIVKDRCSRQVTFSKRRVGLFKKASELATLCGVQIGIVIFSPGGKAYSYGNPSIQFVANRFLNEKEESSGCSMQKESRVRKLNKKLNGLLKQLQEEQKKGEMLEKEMKAYKGKIKPIDKMNCDELLKFKTKLEGLKENFKSHMTELEASSSLLLLSKKPNEKM